MIKRYLDAGMAFTQMTQARAEAIVAELVRAGEVQAGRTEDLVGALVERSRRNTDRLLELVRKEVRSQIQSLGLATRSDVERLEAEVARLRAGDAAPAERAAKSTTKAGAAKRPVSAAKRSTAAKKTAKKVAPRSASQPST